MSSDLVSKCVLRVEVNNSEDINGKFKLISININKIFFSKQYKVQKRWIIQMYVI